jgi:hypothetical protein
MSIILKIKLAIIYKKLTAYSRCSVNRIISYDREENVLNQPQIPMITNVRKKVSFDILCSKAPAVIPKIKLASILDINVDIGNTPAYNCDVKRLNANLSVPPSPLPKNTYSIFFIGKYKR